MALTVTVDVPAEDRKVLESWTRSPSMRAGLAQRARIVLLAADGVPVKDIVDRVGVSKPTVIGWKKRYAAEGLGGLEDRPKPGRPATVDEVAVVLATLEPPPERLGVTHWSSRLLAKRSHDYVRHGTTTLFAALEVATGKVTDACMPRHRHTEFLRFLKQVAKAYPRKKLHIVVDNYGSHKHPNVRAWLAKNPRIQLHFTPTSGSWLNMVEIFFSIITRQAIRRGTFTSVRDLTDAIRAFIDGWNDRCHPFVWTKTADDILDHCKPGQRTSFTRH